MPDTPPRTNHLPALPLGFLLDGPYPNWVLCAAWWSFTLPTPTVIPEWVTAQKHPLPPWPSVLTYSLVTCWRYTQAGALLVSHPFAKQVSACSPLLLSERKRLPFQTHLRQYIHFTYIFFTFTTQKYINEQKPFLPYCPYPIPFFWGGGKVLPDIFICLLKHNTVT